MSYSVSTDRREIIKSFPFVPASFRDNLMELKVCMLRNDDVLLKCGTISI
jgi:hypothetical protein